MTLLAWTGSLGWPELIVLAVMGCFGILALAAVVLVLVLLIRKSSATANQPPTHEEKQTS
ncbi:MAG: hypothetical protein WD118_04935 [Phycisphaeraceae bacterium]